LHILWLTDTSKPEKKLLATSARPTHEVADPLTLINTIALRF